MLSLVVLLFQEAFKLLNLDTILLHLDYTKAILHILAILTMVSENLAKDFVYREELLLKYRAFLITPSLDDVSTPHAYNFPFLEVPEEIF